MIINIETATHVCSVVLSSGLHLVDIRESDREKSHASLLAVFIDDLLKKNNLKPPDLDAVSVSKGPGSYTGLRIGVSTAKGIAYGADIPLVSVNTLHALSFGAISHPKNPFRISSDKEKVWYCPMIDARRMEVFSAFYNDKNEIKRPVSANIIDTNSFSDILSERPVLFFGTGSDKSKSVLNHPNAFFLDDVLPSARFMIPLSNKAYEEKNFENSAYFEPFYLKDFIATIPKKKIYR